MTGPDVWGHFEVREHLGVSRPTLDRYRTLPGFPVATELKSGPVWDRVEIIEWAEKKA